MSVAIIKYNAGNIRSVDYALRRLGVEPVITADKELLRRADCVIFPGVGEAATTMRHLCASGMDQVVRELTQPVLGICLGMQLMCRHSEEGDADGLGIFDVDVKRFVPRRHEDKVPHMGWNTIGRTRSALFDGFADGKDEYVYFVHSYYAKNCSDYTTASCLYGGAELTASAERGNVFGTQYHPEKSGAAGLKILRAFSEMA